MESIEAKTPSQLPDEANQTGREAAGAAMGYTHKMKQTGQDAAASLRSSVGAAKDIGRDAIDSARGYAQDAKETAKHAAESGRAYAKDAVNAAGKKIDDLKDQAAQLKAKGAQFVADDPMKAVAYAAAGSAVLTAVLLSLMRGRR